MSKVIDVEMSQIVLKADQPRLDLYDESIANLAESIKENGLLQPLGVRQIAENKYELLTGERRFRACQLLGKQSVSALVYDVDDDVAKNLALIENIQRKEMDAISQALAMSRLMESEGLTQAQLANKLGYQQSTVANKLRLLKLPEAIRNGIARGTITERHARALLKVEEAKLEEAYLTIVNRKYNVARTEEYVAALNAKHKHVIGISSNNQIAINTFKQAYEMCRKSGIDADYQQSEYDDSIKITIRIRK